MLVLMYPCTWYFAWRLAEILTPGSPALISSRIAKATTLITETGQFFLATIGLRTGRSAS